MIRDNRLGIEFFNRHTVDVAKDLLGQELVFGNYRGILTLSPS